MLQSDSLPAFTDAQAQRIARRAIQWSPGLCAAGLALPFLAVVCAVNLVKGVPIASLTQDPTVVGSLPFYAGFLSNVGVLFWCATAALCLFSAAALDYSARREELRSFLLAAGLLTAFLMLDDLFRLHETMFPRLIGLPEFVVYAGYASLGLLFLLRFRAIVFTRQSRLLAVAVVCLGTSVALDVFPLPAIDRFILEDGLKFAGIVCWFSYFSHACWLALSEQKLREDMRRYVALECSIDADGQVFTPDAVQIDSFRGPAWVRTRDPAG